MRNKIEYISGLINGFATQFKLNSKGILTSDFTEDPELISKIRKFYTAHESMQIEMGLTTWGGETSDDDFDSYYGAALKEFMASTTIEASSSTTLKKSKKTWLDEKKFKDFNWDKGPTESYRERYFKYLSLSGRSEEEIIEVKKSTLSILEGFGNPADSGAFYKRGMKCSIGKNSQFQWCNKWFY
jgi:hypothetical protein